MSLATLVLVLAQNQPPPRLPFEPFGRTLLQRADQERSRSDEPRAGTFQRLEALHDVVDLGAVRVWVPRVVLDRHGEPREGPRWRDVERLVDLVFAIEREWGERIRLEGSTEPVGPALETIGAWLDSATSPSCESSGEVAAARRTVQRACSGGETAWSQEPLVILAPTRAQLVGLIGAWGVADESQRPHHWSDLVGTRTTHWLGRSCIVLPTTRWTDGEPLIDQKLAERDLRQSVAHFTSHLFTIRFAPKLPEWFGEGLAIHDTITLTGGDDTSCSGYSSTGPFAELAQIYVLLSRAPGPFRGEAARDGFVRALKSARKRSAFLLRDLDEDREAFTVAPPFLAGAGHVPKEVAGASLGVRRGYMELFRAYSAAFVRWLDLPTPSAAPRLDRWIRALRTSGDLQDLVSKETGKSLGATAEPEADLEGEFLAWLGG